MKVTSIGLYSNDVEACSFALRRESTDSRYMVRQITGMDSDDLVPKFYGKGLSSGVPMYDFVMKPRELTIRVILNPTFALNEEYGSVRDELYRAISSSRRGEINLRFYAGGTTVAKLFGFITKLEAGYFNKTPEAQITVRCDDPMFRAINPILLETGDANLPTTSPFRLTDSISTSPHGVCFDWAVNADMPEVTIQDHETDPEWKFTITPNTGFLNGDVLSLCSDYSNKYLYLTRGGADQHLMDKIEPGSVWPMLFPGINDFHVVQHADLELTRVKFFPTYWGV